MYEKIVSIHPISKMNPYLEKDLDVREVYSTHSALNISSLFWKELLYTNNLIDHDEIFSNSQFLVWNRVERAADIFGDVQERIPTPKEMVFIYETFAAVVEVFNKKYPEWRLSLTYGLSHKSSDFNSQQIHLAKLEETVQAGGGIIGDMLRNAVDVCDIHDSIVVFKFFWPTDILQLFLISEKLKSKNNIIIVDVTHANEQSDFSQWIEKFVGRTGMSKFFDYMVVYEDYNQAMDRLIRHIQAGNIELPDELSGNIVFFKEEKALFKKPEIPTPPVLFSLFRKYTQNPRNIFLAGGQKSIQMRFLPYRCYWSSCFFCTINSTNPYKYTKDSHEWYITSMIDFIEQNNIDQILFSDEAIHPEDVIFFSKRIIERGIRVTYRFRTRFDVAYTQEACKLLYEAGARFCGIGLECASDRVSDSINKGSKMSIRDKAKIIGNFDKAGIPFHNYSIFWLPGETLEESYETYRFLEKNILIRKNYTCTPNVFNLNKGSMYYRFPEKFQIQIIEPVADEDILNVSTEYWVDFDVHMQRLEYVTNINALQFLSFYNPQYVKEFWPNEFWDFIDRSGIYYGIKTSSSTQPFRYPEIVVPDIMEVIHKKYQFSPFIEWVSQENGGFFRNITNGFEVFVPKMDGKEIWKKWQANKTLEENIETIFIHTLFPETIQSILGTMIRREILEQVL